MTDVAASCPIVDPGGGATRERVAAAAALGTLAGRRIAVLDITKVRSDAFVEQVEASLREREDSIDLERGVAPPSQRMTEAELAGVAERCDGAVLALADCGTCSSWTLFDAIELHRRGCRAVLVTTHALRPTVDALAERLGLPELPVVEVQEPNREQTSERIAVTARAAAPAIATALVGAG